MKAIVQTTIKYTLSVIFGFLLATNAKAQNPESLMAKANSLYNEGSYDSAAAIYNSIIDQNYSSATLYYNLGNTYYKLNNYPMSIYYYEKSLKLDPKNEDTKHNLDIAKQFIKDKIEPMPEFFVKTWWNNLSNMFSTDLWSIVSLILLATSLACIFIYITAKNIVIRKSTFFISLLMIILTICSFSITTKKYKYINSQNEGIIINPTITVKSSPSSSSVDLFVLHEGSKVKILDQTDNWEKVKIDNGSIGWLPSTSIIKY